VTDRQQPSAKSAEPELDAEAKALKLEQVKAEARKAIAEANAGALTAGLYQSTSQPAKGETTLDEKSGSLLSIVALRSLNSLSGEIAEAVEAAVGQGKAIVIVGDRSLALTDAARAEINVRFEWFREQFEATLDQLQRPAVPPPQQRAEVAEPALAPMFAALPVAQAALSAVGLAADLVGMFKTDYAMQGRAVAFDQSAVAAGVAGRLSRHGSVVVDGFQTLEQSSTLRRFKELLDLRRQVEQAHRRCDALELAATSDAVERLSTRAAAVGTALAKALEADKLEVIERAEKTLAELDDQLAHAQTSVFLARKQQVAAAKALTAAFDQYATAITTLPAGASSSALIAAALHDSLHDGIQTAAGTVPVDYVLYLSIASSGGDITTQSGLFKNNDYIRLVAAVQASYLLATRSGGVAAAGSHGASSAAKVKLSDNKVEWYDSPGL
jgi:hypothetical protein